MTAEIVFWTAIVAMIAATLYLAPRITRSRMAMQWGIDGRPTWTAPKWAGAWGLVAVALILRAIIWAAATWTPQFVHGVEPGLVLMSVVLVLSHVFVLWRATKSD
jgi:hypothetical protein